MSREWENWFILKEENHIFGVRCIVSKILHPHVCNSVMSAGIMLVYHRFGGIIFSKSLPSRISLPFSSPLKPCFLIFWPEMWDFQMSILLPVSRNWGDPLGKALAAGGGEVFKKWECSLPSLALSSPFSTLLDRKTGNPLLQLHCRSALCKTQTKKEVKEEREKSATPILSGPQGSPFLILWTERQDFSEFQLSVVLMCQLYQEPTLKTMSKKKAKLWEIHCHTAHFPRF